MIKGGISDKLGNNYEAKWLVQRFIHLIANELDWIKFEGLEAKYEGFEFAVGRGEITEWHQTKINAPTGNWTLNRLGKEGVLQAFSRILKADQNSECYFVSQDNAKTLRSLSEKAQVANSYKDFLGVLSKKQLNTHFKRFKTVTEISGDQAFHVLSRIRVRFIPEEELDILIRSFGDLYFHGNPAQVFPSLRDILEQNFNRKIGVKTARNLLQNQAGLELKEWSLDPSLKQRIHGETEAYLNTYTPFGVGGEVIEREQTKAVVDQLFDNGIDLILLTGQAGSGKSGIVRAAIKELQVKQVPHLAFRVDHHLSCNTVSELGNQLTGRSESPVSTLKGTFPDSNSVLFIDQVDAISEVSGRQGGIREVLFQLFDDAYCLNGVKVVVSCRKFDLENDSRLKRLKNENRITEVKVPFLDWGQEASPLLEDKGFNTASFSQAQQKLLRLPVNLSIFLEINDKDLSFNSRSSLHERLLKHKQDKISRERDVQWSLIEPLESISNWMSERQRLTAPVFVLDQYSNAVNILCSEGLIVSSQGQLNFFHESFFDHVYARAFLTKSRSVVDFLTSEGKEQHLFRRTQVRQILEVLRKYDPDRYKEELKEVLNSDKVRFHIKVAVSQWLNSVNDPTESEFRVISSFNQGQDGYHQFFRRAVLSSSAWFKLLHGKNWIQFKLEDRESLREPVLRWLSNITDEYSDEIAELLHSWWELGESNRRTGRLLKWFGHTNIRSCDQKLIELCEILIKADPEYLYEGDGRNQISMILHSWDEKSADGFGQILKTLFEVWFDLYPDRNPFQNGLLEAFGAHSLNRVSDKAPICFLEGATEMLLNTVDLARKSAPGDVDWVMFDRRTYAGHRMDFDEFLSMYRSAIKSVAEGNPDLVAQYLDQIDPHRHETFMHLHLETIQANPSYFASRLTDLVKDNLVFKAGWNRAQWYSFAHAYKKSSPHLSQEAKAEIEGRILEYRPSLKVCANVLESLDDEDGDRLRSENRVIHTLKRSGHSQWCILETIGEESLTLEKSKSRLAELRRKFPDEKVAQPESTAAGFVPSPIEAEKSKKMSDKDWLLAFEEYDNDPEKRQKRGIMSGGARQLAGVLQQQAKEAPNRFAGLGLKIPYTAPETYFTHLLWGLAEQEDLSEDLLAKVIKHADKHPEKPFGKQIARLIGNHPYIANHDEILDILISYALEGSFEVNLNRNITGNKSGLITIDELTKKSRRDYAIGMNSVRGSAWEALESILWKGPEVEDNVWEAIEVALKAEPEIYVRCCILKALIPIFNSDKKRFSRGIKELVNVPNGESTSRFTPLMTSRGLYIWGFMFSALPELAKEIVNEFLVSSDQTIELIGSWLIYRESFRNEDYVAQADNISSQSNRHERLLASLTSKAIKWAGNRDRAKSLLESFFFHDDKVIQEVSAKAFRNVPEDEIEDFIGLAKTFVKSPAFDVHASSLFGMIEKANCDVIDIIVKATERLIELPESQNGPHGNRTTDLHQVQKLLKREYSSTERDTEVRSKVLDLIDDMLKSELYGVNRIVKAHDRW